MSNWIKFDADKPETWPGTQDDVLIMFDEGFWCQAFFRGGQFRNHCNGQLVYTDNVTHYMIPSPPAEQPDAETYHWWCLHCRQKVDDVEVTYEETHESCGSAVELQPDCDKPDTVSVPMLLDTADSSWFKWLLVDAKNEDINAQDVWKAITTRFKAKEQIE